MTRPQISSRTINPKDSPLGPQKVKNDPKIESKSIIKIDKIIQLQE